MSRDSFPKFSGFNAQDLPSQNRSEVTVLLQELGRFRMDPEGLDQRAFSGTFLKENLAETGNLSCGMGKNV
jgi:hypothetical protein